MGMLEEQAGLRTMTAPRELVDTEDTAVMGGLQRLSVNRVDAPLQSAERPVAVGLVASEDSRSTILIREGQAETEETPVSQEGQRQAARAAVRSRSAPPQAPPISEAPGGGVDTGTPTATGVTTAMTRTSS